MKSTGFWSENTAPPRGLSTCMSNTAFIERLKHTSGLLSFCGQRSSTSFFERFPCLGPAPLRTCDAAMSTAVAQSATNSKKFRQGELFSPNESKLRSKSLAPFSRIQHLVEGRGPEFSRTFGRWKRSELGDQLSQVRGLGKFSCSSCCLRHCLFFQILEERIGQYFSDLRPGIPPN